MSIRTPYNGAGRRIDPGAVLLALLAATLPALLLAAIACNGDEPEPGPDPTPTQEIVVQSTPEPEPPSFVGDNEAIWADDFESYSDGAFPREGGWQRWKSGAVHIISSESSAGGSKSYKVGKFAQTAKAVPKGLPQVSYTAKFMVASVDENIASPLILVGLGWKMEDANVPHATACGVWVSGRLRCGDMDLGPAEAGRWYEVHVIADLASGSAQYWLDGQDLGVLPLETIFGVPKDNISHFLMVSGPRETEAFIDDVAVFRGEVSPLSPTQP